MKIEFDPAKNERNTRERGLPFEMVRWFVWETCLTRDDLRFPYPEPRRVSVGYIGERLHVVCHTPIEGGIRVISLRKANDREKRKYEEEKTAY